MRLAVYAHCTIDEISVGGSRYRQAGGPACYCGHAARQLKFDVTLYTKFGPDFPGRERLDDLRILHPNSMSDEPTTRFRIDVHGPQRDLYLESRCEPICHAESASDGIVVSPVFDEIAPEVLCKIKESSEFILLDPQGFLRRAGPDSRIRLERADIDLSGVTAIKASPEEMRHLVGSTDLEGMKALQKRGVCHVLRTDGADVSMLDGDRMYSLRLPNTRIHDTTGIGDIFAATFACTMLKERDSIWALCFAGGAAQAALESGDVGLQKVPPRGATSTNASYFYNMIDFRQV